MTTIPRSGSVVAVASGKGGVGKSTVVANLGVALSRLRRRTLILDADFSLANIDVLLGLAPRFTIQHFFMGECELTDLILEGPSGVRVIPAASGIPDLTRIEPARRRALAEGIETLRRNEDCLLIDLPAGIGDTLVQIARSADQILVVATPDPASLVDAYATIKVLVASAAGEGAAAAAPGLVVNGARDDGEARSVHTRLEQACRRFLGRSVPLLGQIVRDDTVEASVRDQRAVVESHPHSAASRCFQDLARRIGCVRAADEPRTELWGRLFAGGEARVH